MLLIGRSVRSLRKTLLRDSQYTQMMQEVIRTARFFRRHPIGQAQPFATWRRWCWWQLKTRTLRGPFTVPWINNSKLIVERGMTGATGNVYCGLHEFADMALVIHYLSGLQRGAI